MRRSLSTVKIPFETMAQLVLGQPTVRTTLQSGAVSLQEPADCGTVHRCHPDNLSSHSVLGISPCATRGLRRYQRTAGGSSIVHKSLRISYCASGTKSFPPVQTTLGVCSTNREDQRP